MRRPQPTQPHAGQESVWAYPRPPRVEPSAEHIQVIVGGVIIAETFRAQRVLETSHPPVYYIPPEDVRLDLLRPNRHATLCEFKGTAAYYDLVIDALVVPRIAWYYPEPTPAFASLRDHVAFYPGKVEAALVDGERVQAQPGDFYGGWITSRVVGPFKGAPGTMGW